MEKELLQKALDSILHGSTQIVSTTDFNGQVNTQEVRINDLRIPLVNKLAEKMLDNEAFTKALVNALSDDFIKTLRDKMISNAKFSDLPYKIRDEITKEMTNTKLEIRNYKLIAEVIKEV